ncbi:hypothetical protein L596_023951 [Steinernema carpocapsae]|uniref:Uncharacterized protein n=1 Tax=Steinernema carpocapsae TaxID=34508 RepID=A0A4U5MF92_STECR|nr:hypothetical protein L596_023951 [Steinernema carpocapsae]
MPAQGEATSSTSKATATRPTATPRRGARGAPKETKEPEAEEAGNGESEETAAVEPAVKKTKEAPAPAAEDNGDKAEAEKSEEAQVAEKEPEAEKEKPKKNGEEPAEPASEAAEPMETEPPQIERHMEEQSAADVVAPTEVKTEEPDHEGGGDADTSDNRYPDHYFVGDRFPTPQAGRNRCFVAYESVGPPLCFDAAPESKTRTTWRQRRPDRSKSDTSSGIGRNHDAGDRNHHREWRREDKNSVREGLLRDRPCERHEQAAVSGPRRWRRGQGGEASTSREDAER